MGLYEGLDQIKKYQEELERRRQAAENKANWLSMKDKETVKLRFLQEFDKSASGYNEEAGLAFIATEHTNPANYRRRALCTADEGACYGCEMHQKDWQAGWGAKSRMYINALVERADGEREVAIVSHSNSSKATLTPMLLMQAVEANTVTDRWWRMTRNGTKKTTNYTPMPLAETNDIDVTDYLSQMFDLKEVAVRHVPYEEQAEFYNKGANEDSERSEAPAVADDASSPDSEW